MEGAPGFRPLYRQVYDYLLKQIADGSWGPGESLPSEQALAQELGVSQGTVRKALDAMAAENVIERRQGKGTYVAEQTQERALFRFFRLAYPEGQRVTPECGDESVTRRQPSPKERRKLDLDEGEEVVEIIRTRLVEGRPAVFEVIILPTRLFPDIETHAPLPNALYSVYQSAYGVNIVTAEEELKADLVRKEDAQRLGLAIGTPILHIERVAIAIDGTAAEWRTSRCDTRNVVYAVTIR